MAITIDVLEHPGSSYDMMAVNKKDPDTHTPIRCPCGEESRAMYVAQMLRPDGSYEAFKSYRCPAHFKDSRQFLGLGGGA